MRGKPYVVRAMSGLTKPKITRLGVDVAGQVEAVGRKVTQFKPGDEVFGACRGAFAEYGCTPESSLVTKPRNLTFEQAGAVSVAGRTALQGLRDKGQIQAGQKVLVNGAAGGVGTLWDLGISGADLVIACVGAGLRAFTRFTKVEYDNGEEVPAERFLTEVETAVLETILERLSKEVGAKEGRHGLERQALAHMPSTVSVSRSGSCMIIEGL